MFFNSPDILSPYITTVTCDSVFFVGPGSGGFTDGAMTGNAIHACTPRLHLSMGGMGEKDAVRLF
jgi:hypothetical protein